MDRVRRERDRFVNFVLDDVAAIAPGDKLEGYAHFVSDTVLEVGGHTWVGARGIVVATGASPVVPAIYSGRGDRVVVHDDVFAWHDLPRRLAVVGTGVCDPEFGQGLATPGSSGCGR